MTIAIHDTPPSRPGRPKGSTGNGKTMKEMVAREERRIAQIEFQKRADEARSEAESALKVAELRAEQRARKTELYVKQEAARAPQFQIDQRPTLWLLGALAAVMFVTTAILTADGTIGSAASARYAEPWMGFVLFGAIEVAILVFMLVYYVNGSRIDYEGEPIPANHWFVMMVVASVAAAGLSVYHVIDLYEYDWLSIDMWFGVGIRLLTSVFFVVVSKAIAGVLFAKAIRL